MASIQSWGVSDELRKWVELLIPERNRQPPRRSEARDLGDGAIIHDRKAHGFFGHAGGTSMQGYRKPLGLVEAGYSGPRNRGTGSGVLHPWPRRAVATSAFDSGNNAFDGTSPVRTTMLRQYFGLKTYDSLDWESSLP